MNNANNNFDSPFGVPLKGPFPKENKTITTTAVITISDDMMINAKFIFFYSFFLYKTYKGCVMLDLVLLTILSCPTRNW